MSNVIDINKPLRDFKEVDAFLNSVDELIIQAETRGFDAENIALAMVEASMSYCDEAGLEMEHLMHCIYACRGE